VKELLSILFVALWGMAGLVGGLFFRRVRSEQTEHQPRRGLPLDVMRGIALVALLLIVIAASEIGRIAEVIGDLKLCAAAVCVVTCIVVTLWRTDRKRK